MSCIYIYVFIVRCVLCVVCCVLCAVCVLCALIRKQTVCGGLVKVTILFGVAVTKMKSIAAVNKKRMHFSNKMKLITYYKLRSDETHVVDSRRYVIIRSS
jgi:hypothetical protein